MALIINIFLIIGIIYFLMMGKRMLFGSVFVLALLIFFANDLKNNMRVNYQFVQTQCRILDKKVETDEYLYLHLYRPYFLTGYSVNEQPTANAAKFNITNYPSFSEEMASRKLNAYASGVAYPCWYDPNDPTDVVLAQGWTTIFDSWKVVILNALVLLIMLIKTKSD